MDDPFFSVSADDTGSTFIGRSRSLFDNTAQVLAPLCFNYNIYIYTCTKTRSQSNGLICHLAEGKLYGRVKIGDKVEKGQTIAVICTENGEEVKVEATLTGLVRGLIRDAYPVTVGFKIAEIDPRESEYKNCFTISDKARNIGGSVLEGLMYLEEKQGY